jgi:hypothetical protein
MSSLTELYEEIVAQDQEKYASETESYDNEEETVKIAQEYDAAGRIMCRAFFDEMFKTAQEGALPPEEEKSEEEKKKKEEEKKKKGAAPANIEQMLAEKKASIMERMGQDSDYAQQLVAKYMQPE